MKNSPYDRQVGGSHYKDFKIQPAIFITKNSLGWLEGCIIERLCRYKLKGSPLEDLQKAAHELEMLIDSLSITEENAPLAERLRKARWPVRDDKVPQS